MRKTVPSGTQSQQPKKSKKRTRLSFPAGFKIKRKRNNMLDGTIAEMSDISSFESELESPKKLEN